ncbi:MULTISPECIES: M61 family metallopeptidase [Rheinheimera]|uniref:M61 family metallopeptidase n=1 Tax=Rheinheimera marina TaxID=1774958 RepID=A0ABV9JFT4_9GAMM
MKVAVGAWALLLLSPTAVAQTKYSLDLSAREQHQLAVDAEYQLPDREPLELRMASASPGRYARHDFAKNIYALKATDGQGRELPITRLTPSSWQVQGHQGVVKVSYLLFGNRADGTYSQIDSRHVHLNMPASFLYAPALAQQPLTVQLKQLPERWSAASQLALQPDGGLQAANLDYFMDSPLELSEHQLLSFEQNSNGKNYRIELALHHQGPDHLAKALLEKTKAVVQQQQAVFGELPDFAGQRYTFIADYQSGINGDGMEHRNSTVVTSSKSLAQAELSQIETISHEFFHAWNVERLRPQNLQPFDFTQTNMSNALWFAEGFTNYYGKLLLKRSGHFSLEKYLEKVQGPLNSALQAPGRRWYGPAAMSQQAVFVDAGVSIDPTNYANTFLSYYTYGEVVALGLDLTLRTQYQTDLDALMKRMWQQFGRAEKPYQLADIEQALAEVSGDRAFARRFFQDSIEGPALPDYPALFAQLGLQLKPEHQDKAWLGPLTLEPFGDALLVRGVALHGSAWALAGVTDGDLLLQLGDVRLASKDDLNTALAAAKVGDELTLTLRRFDQPLQLTLKVQTDPQLVLTEDPKASKAQRKKRDAWLAAKQI